MPVVAAVEGVAAGAGCSLALCADIVIAGRSARLDMAFVRIGLVPDCGALHTLPRLIGTARARAMMLLGEPVDGATAADWGLIWKAVDDGAAVGEARAVAARLAAGPTLALRLIRHALRDGGAAGLDAALDAERALQSEAAGSADFAEGVAAFREKRPPVFRGE
jgi:2-(1,2-epoxy-1,2-dihydrophenyl)acetyl-CoA isomerase